ncbi:MAG: winged helix-turn-helix domain-containing protein [Candidatus Dojkabacteria bacterium]|nr:MAG: winged helix-turn-helix domain-containing protein [Candidatus Dojkabacteria bacterium]
MNMTTPETIWEYSKTTEARRYCTVARTIQSYFFQTKGFLVLPKPETYDVSSVYFPNLPIIHHKDFWQKIETFDQYNETTQQQVVKDVEEFITLAQPPEEQKTSWQHIEKDFWAYMSTFLPVLYDRIDRLVIRQTQFGTVSSSIGRIHKKDRTLRLSIRFDADFSHIASAIFIGLTSETDPHSPLYGHTWEERQSIGDFLMNHTLIKSLFPHHQPTVKTIRHELPKNLRAASQHYLTELGFPPKQLITINDHKQVLVNQKCLPLSTTEHKVFSLFIEKRNQIVTPAEIAQELWQDQSYERFSLYAIAKVVERLRKHIQNVGIYTGLIETRRGQGFVLND